jgi:putative DNA primase/helicase
MVQDNEHKYAAVFEQNIPAELKAFRFWVMWRKERREGKPTKVLYQTNRRQASSTRASTWTTFEEALDTLAQDDFFDGIGFVFHKTNPYCGADIDHVTEEQAQSWIKRFNSYAERSPSGEGFHIICKAEVPRGTKRDEGELYSSGRFFTVTGDVVHDAPVREAQDAADEFYGFLRRHDFEPKEERQTTTPPMTDAEVVRLAESAKNGHEFGVIYGGGGDFGSDSERDSSLAWRLAFWTQDEAQIERIMRGSGCAREKWNKHRTYLRDTIRKALDSLTETYTPPGRRGKGPHSDNNDNSDNNFQDLADLPDPEEFPLHALPHGVGQFAREAAASIGCPTDYTGLSTLAALRCHW